MIITGGKYNGRKIITPNESITRPTLSKIRQGVFNTLFSILGDFENKTFLDLFGGSGIMGLEALSRDFSKVIVFEKNRQAAQIIKKNYTMLKEKLDLKIGDSLKLINKIKEDIDVIYIDPPYYIGIYEEIFNEIKKNNLANSLIIVEHTVPLHIRGFSIIKEKKYGDKLISFYKQDYSQDS